MFMKMPIRGFSNARFRTSFHAINLDQIEAVFEEGETVNRETLMQRGFIKGRDQRVKILGDGELTKKVKIEVDAFSETAREKLKKAKIHFADKKQA